MQSLILCNVNPDDYGEVGMRELEQAYQPEHEQT